MDKEQAREELTAAIKNFISFRDSYREGEEIVDTWAIVVHLTPIEANGASAYTIFSDHENTPAHIYQGMFYEGLHLSSTGGKMRNED